MTPPDHGAQKLADLFHHKWAPAILAELARTGGSRAVVLRNRLGASPNALAPAVDRLIALGLIAPNPGYGHPLRPEYLLTADGAAAAEACARIARAAQRLNAGPITERKWTLPVLWTMGRSPMRFGQIARLAAPITDRALSQALALLVNSRLVRTSALPDRPPADLYCAAPRAATLLDALDELAA